MLQNNLVRLTGRAVEEPRLSHMAAGESIYSVKIETERLSGQYDVIPVQIPESLLPSDELAGRTIRVTGEFHSRNRSDESGSHLILSVFARELELYDGPVVCSDNNMIRLNGFLCKAPVFRVTPRGREIADLLLAVNRSYGRPDYLPCIVWGNVAKEAGSLSVGAPVMVEGRIQSRQYIKRLSETECEERTAYEVSGSRIGTWEQDVEAVG